MCIHWVHSSLMKDVGLRIRVQRELREQFLDACRTQDKPAAQVLREFMREYVTTHTSVHHSSAGRHRVVDNEADRLGTVKVGTGEPARKKL